MAAETKKATAKRILHNVRQFTSKNVNYYVHKIEFDNGDSGEYNSTKEVCEKFTEGKAADYTIETRTNGNYTNVIIKPVQQNGPGYSSAPFNKSGSGGSLEGFALSYAKDLAVAYVKSGKQVDPKKVCEWGDVFLDWLRKNKQAPAASAEPAAKPVQQSTPAKVSAVLALQPDDDLPF